MSDTDSNQLPTTYHRGVAGTISGFDQFDGSLGEVNISLAQIYAKLEEIQTKYSGSNFNPTILNSLLTNHIADNNNPHHDTFASLGVDIANDLVGSIIPGTVPSQAPSYSLEPMLLLPNANLPATMDLPQYVSDIDPIITDGTDPSKGANLTWMNETRDIISLADFVSSKNAYGYSVLPTVNVGIGLPGILCQSHLTRAIHVDPTQLGHDPYTVTNSFSWSITTTDKSVKLLPTVSVPINTDVDDYAETTFLWPSLKDIYLGNNLYVYLIFTTADNDRLVVCFSKDTRTIVDVVYKRGSIEPVFNSKHHIGGVRFNGKKGDKLTINWTITGTPDWSNYADHDITFSGGDVSFDLPAIYPMMFLLGNPNFLSGYKVLGTTISTCGLLSATPTDGNLVTPSLSWNLPILSTIKNIGMFNLTVCVDNSVTDKIDPITIFSSDTLKIGLVTYDDGTDSGSVWNISVTNGTDTTNLIVNGGGGHLQSIALSLDGASLRVRVSGDDGVSQIPSKVQLTGLPNSRFGDFSGAVMNLTTYGVTDDGNTLNFLVGDTPRTIQ